MRPSVDYVHVSLYNRKATMATYKYKAQDSSGKIVAGIQDADDDIVLHRLLREQDLLLLSSKEVKAKNKGQRQLKDKLLSSFTLKLSELLGSGVPMIRALTIISEEETNTPRETAIYKNIIEMIKQGNQLSQAMEEENGAFPPLLISMIRSAEEAGNLPEVCKRMSIHYEKEYKFNAKIKSATTYPKILAVLIVVVVAIIMGFVLPQFEPLFAQMETLPLPTTILFAITDFVTANWIGIAITIVIVVLIWNIAIRFNRFKCAVDYAKLHLPLIGKNNATVCTARFARTFSSLYSSGVNAITALQIAQNTTGNAYIESQFTEAITMVKNGHLLSESLATIDGFNRKFISSVKVGEESGNIEDMLNSTADSMEFEAEQAMERIVGYLEPAMIVFMAAIVGFVIVAVIVPIYGSYSTISTSTTAY